MPRLDLTNQVAPVSVDEVAKIVRETPSDRAPDLDGFNESFYKAA